MKFHEQRAELRHDERAHRLVNASEYGGSGAEEVQRVVLSKRGKTEGVIGTLKSEKYGFNKPKQRNPESLRAAGQQALLSLNLNKLMRDLLNADQQATLVGA